MMGYKDVAGTPVMQNCVFLKNVAFLSQIYNNMFLV